MAAACALAVLFGQVCGAADQWWAVRGFDDTGGDRVPKCVRALKDGTLIVAGQAIDPKGISLGWVARLDRSGNVLGEESRVYAPDGRTESALNWIEPLSGGGFIACGWAESTSPTVGGRKGWLIRLDALGRLKWSQELGGAGSGELMRVQAGSDGALIAVGRYSEAGLYPTDGWAVSLKPSGRVLWSATFGDALDDEFRDARATTAGGYVVAGVLTKPIGTKRVGWVLGLSRTGEIEWQKTYGGSTDRELNAIGDEVGGGFVAAGELRTGALTSSAWLIKLGPAGEEIWQWVRRGATGGQLRMSAVELDGRGRIYAGGTSTVPLAGTEAVAVGVSSTGLVEWSKSLGSPWAESLSALDLTSTGIALAGTLTGYHGDGGAAQDSLVFHATWHAATCDGVSQDFFLEPHVALNQNDVSSVERISLPAETTKLAGMQRDSATGVAAYCGKPFLEQTLTLSRSPHIDGVTIIYACANSGRDTVPFKAKVYFSPTDSYPDNKNLLSVLDVAFPAGLREGETSKPYYSISAKGRYKYAIAVIDSENNVIDNLNGVRVIRMPLP